MRAKAIVVVSLLATAWAGWLCAGCQKDGIPRQGNVAATANDNDETVVVSERTMAERIAALRTAMDEQDAGTAYGAVAELVATTPSAPEAQEAALDYMRKVGEDGDLRCMLHLRFAKRLAGFREGFAEKVVAQLRSTRAGDGCMELFWLLTLVNMQERATAATPALEVMAADPVHSEGRMRVALILLGQRAEEDTRWLAERIRRRSKAGLDALVMASLTGLGPASRNETVLAALRELVGDDTETPEYRHESARLSAAVVLALSGCTDADTVNAVRRIGRDSDDGESLLCDYALSMMDHPGRREHLRDMLSKLAGGSHTEYAAMLCIVFSMSDVSKGLIVSLQADRDSLVSEGARDFVGILWPETLRSAGRANSEDDDEDNSP